MKLLNILYLVGSFSINHGRRIGQSPRALQFGTHMPGFLASPSSVVLQKNVLMPRYKTNTRPIRLDESTSSELSFDSPPPKSKVLFEGLGKGLIRDIKNRCPRYTSDITDGLNIKVLSSIFFLFFACLAPAIAFGGLLEKATLGAIGTMEMLTATAACGIFYSLASAQPLTIIGSTGPVLAFIAVLYKFAQQLSLPFLPLYSWVGLWCAGILGVCTLTSASNLVDYLTRFTDEIFSLLISVIFIFEASKDLGYLFASASVPFSLASGSLITALMTFGVSKVLSSLRRSVFFRKPIRNTVADFAPTLGVLSGVGVALAMKNKCNIPFPTLAVPDVFATTTGRPWLVPLFDLPVWARWAAAGPSVMLAVLLFMDQNITVRLVNSSKHKLKKGWGFHLDLGCISILTAVSSLFGVPWLVAATVRSINHVKSLAEYETRPGSSEVEMVGTKEQRVSALAIHALIGAAILTCRPLLQQMPLAVLMGLFLYLGFSALSGNQFYERTKLFITDPGMYPQEKWATAVGKGKVRLFTAIQMACLGAMWWVKGSPVGVFFPVIIATLAPIRFAIEKVGLFTKEEMEHLDAED